MACTEIEAKLLSDALFTSPNELLHLIGGILNLDFGDILSAKIDDFLKDSKKGIPAKLEARVKEVKNGYIREHLILHILSQMNEIYEIPARHFVSEKDFSDNFEQIVNKSLENIKSNDKEFRGDNLQALVQHLVKKMFVEVGKNFQGNKLTPEQQNKIIGDIKDFVSHMPEEQRKKILDELKVDHLSDDYIRTALISGSLGGAFAATVVIGGFSFYMGAASLLSTVFGLIGITLPFGVYAGMSSFIAVVANPLFWIPALLGGGIFLYQTTNKKIKKSMIELILTQLILSHQTIEEKRPKCTEQVLVIWREMEENLMRLRKELFDKKKEIVQAEYELNRTKSKISDSQEEIKRLNDSVEQIGTSLEAVIAREAANIAWGRWGEELIRGGKAIVAEQRRLENDKNKERGFWETIKFVFTDDSNLPFLVNQVKYQLIPQVKESFTLPKDVKNSLELRSKYINETAPVQKNLKENQTLLLTQESKLSHLGRQARDIEENKNKLENRFWGLEAL